MLNKQFFFMHIPKTGGMTLRNILDSVFTTEETFPYLRHEQIGGKNLTKTDLREYKCIKGHFQYFFMLQLLDQRPFCFTVLRDPVERSLSHYAHMQMFDRIGPGSGLDLEQFMESPGGLTLMRNLQTRYLTDQFPGTNSIELAFQLKNRWFDIRDKRGTIAPAEQAIGALNNFVNVVGVTEYFDQFIELLFWKAGWGEIPHYNMHNVTPKDIKPQQETVPLQIIEQIKYLNQEDIKLYEYAKKRFEKEYKEMIGNV